MNKLATLVLFFGLFIAYQSSSQVNPNSPFENFDDTPLTRELTLKITNGLSNDSLKLVAIYDWIVQNISYDSLLYTQQRNPLYWRNYIFSKGVSKIKPLHSCSDILAKKKTICLGYAYLFSAMCQVVGIKNEVVKGYGRLDTVAVNAPNHAWVAFKLSDKWYLADPTWDSGMQAMIEDKRLMQFSYLFFMQKPELFLETHFPLDPLWQMQSSILSLKDWNSFTKNTAIPASAFNYTDSLKQYENNDAKKNFVSSLNRIIGVKEYAFIGHFEYCSYLFGPMAQEAIYYGNLNRQLNTGNKNIEEMARKILPRKKELFERLARIESYIKQYNYHLSKLSQVPNPFKDFFSVKDVSSELTEIRKYSTYLAQERSSLEATIKELEPYQKKSSTRK